MSKTGVVFPGYPAGYAGFFRELAANNSREWFEGHRQDYVDQVQRPTQDYINALGPLLAALSPGIRYDTRTNGGGSMMRIHRDLRFSQDKTPYQVWQRLGFWQGRGKKTEHPAFMVHVDVDGARLFTGMYGFDREMLAAWREAVADAQMGAGLEMALAEVAAAGAYEVNPPHYKRVPRGYDAEHPRARLLCYNTLYLLSPQIDVATVTSPQFVEVSLEHFRNMAPVHRWLVELDRRARGG